MQRFFSSTGASVAIYLAVIGVICWGSYTGAQNMGYNWQWYRVPQYLYSFTDDGFQLGELLIGLGATLQLSVTAFALACVLGLVIALLRLSGLVIGSAVAIGFLEFVRNIPLLVLLYLFYYVLGPIFGFDRYWASILTLGVFHSALISEILRAGINAVAQGQWEAAKSIGMSTSQTYRYIILPQSVRFMLPPMTGEVVHLIKSSAIVSVIAGGRTDHLWPQHHLGHVHEFRNLVHCRHGLHGRDPDPFCRRKLCRAEIRRRPISRNQPLKPTRSLP